LAPVIESVLGQVFHLGVDSYTAEHYLYALLTSAPLRRELARSLTLPTGLELRSTLLPPDDNPLGSIRGESFELRRGRIGFTPTEVIVQECTSEVMQRGVGQSVRAEAALLAVLLERVPRLHACLASLSVDAGALAAAASRISQSGSHSWLRKLFRVR
jgi:hypothetical protein